MPVFAHIVGIGRCQVSDIVARGMSVAARTCTVAVSEMPKTRPVVENIVCKRGLGFANI